VSRQAINAPPAQPPIYSLLVAADLVNDSVRWQQGVEWAPEQISGGGITTVDCHGASPFGKPRSANPIRNTADPFVVFAEDHCSTIGFEARDYEGRARRQLAATQSAFIAHELQHGLVAGNSGGFDNVSLVDGVEVTPGGPADVALASLEQALAETFAGARCMIHVTEQTLVVLAKNFLVYKEGQKWLTHPGNIVVADAGYDEESGGTTFMYGTSMVQVRLSPVDVLPGEFAQAVDKATNLVTLYAERLALVQFDSSNQTKADSVFKVATDLTPWSVAS
jgi:hypothetical protein